MPCNNEQLKEELLNRILLQNDKYSKELVERAITSCCVQNSTEIELCAIEKARQLYLIDYKSDQ